MNDMITDVFRDAVAQGLDLACTTHNIIPPQGFTRTFWAQGVLNECVRLGRLPTQADLNAIVAGLPPLFVSDQNR